MTGIAVIFAWRAKWKKLLQSLLKEWFLFVSWKLLMKTCLTIMSFVLNILQTMSIVLSHNHVFCFEHFPDHFFMSIFLNSYVLFYQTIVILTFSPALFLFLAERKPVGTLWNIFRIRPAVGGDQLFAENHVLVWAPGSCRNRDFCSVSHGHRRKGSHFWIIILKYLIQSKFYVTLKSYKFLIIISLVEKLRGRTFRISSIITK